MLTRMFDDTFARLEGDMDRLFQGFWQDRGAPAMARAYSTAYPPINAWEDGEAAWLESELPGLTMDDIEVLVRGNEVSIKGERKIGTADANAMWLMRERGQGSFTRTFTFPWEIDADKVEAKLRDGVLTVRLPKAESHKPKKIKVLAS